MNEFEKYDLTDQIVAGVIGIIYTIAFVSHLVGGEYFVITLYTWMVENLSNISHTSKV